MNFWGGIGRLTAEPELKKTEGDTSVLSFSIAVPRNYVKQGEERKADFFKCVAWRQQAEFISKYFHKGSKIAITGTLQQRIWEDKNGANRDTLEIVVSSADFCESKQEESKRNLGIEYQDIKDIPDTPLPF